MPDKPNGTYTRMLRVKLSQPWQQLRADPLIADVTKERRQGMHDAVFAAERGWPVNFFSGTLHMEIHYVIDLKGRTVY